MTFKGEEGVLKGRGVRVESCASPLRHAHDEVRPGEPELSYEDIGREMS